MEVTIKIQLTINGKFYATGQNGIKKSIPSFHLTTQNCISFNYSKLTQICIK